MLGIRISARYWRMQEVKKLKAAGVAEPYGKWVPNEVYDAILILRYLSVLSPRDGTKWIQFNQLQSCGLPIRRTHADLTRALKSPPSLSSFTGGCRVAAYLQSLFLFSAAVSTPTALNYPALLITKQKDYE